MAAALPRVATVEVDSTTLLADYPSSSFQGRAQVQDKPAPRSEPARWCQRGYARCELRRIVAKKWEVDRGRCRIPTRSDETSPISSGVAPSRSNRSGLEIQRHIHGPVSAAPARRRNSSVARGPAKRSRGLEPAVDRRVRYGGQGRARCTRRASRGLPSFGSASSRGRPGGAGFVSRRGFLPLAFAALAACFASSLVHARCSATARCHDSVCIPSFFPRHPPRQDPSDKFKPSAGCGQADRYTRLDSR